MSTGIPLYFATILDLLRQCQKKGGFPNWKVFKKTVMNEMEFNVGQSSALTQRLKLLESFLIEAEDNVQFQSIDLAALFEKNPLVVADLTDPLLSPDEANGIFQVLLNQFQSVELPKNRGKLAVF